MPVELMSAIGEANATSSPANRLVPDEDALLVAAAKARNTRAFELLVERHERRIFSMAQRITRNREDAEDVAHQSFQKAFIHLTKFEGESLFSTWLTRIAINEARMLLRRKRGSHEVPIEESSKKTESALPQDFLDSAPNPEDRCLDREQKQILSAALNKLRPGIRKAIELRELGELSTEETALVMGLSVAAVKGRVFHGRRKLRETLRQRIEGRKEREQMSSHVRILGIAGSLRRGSYNQAALRAAKLLVPENGEIDLFQLDDLPMFNEDDEKRLPSSVVGLKKRIRRADALLIVTPEYNYSIPGVLKNAIDWACRPHGDSAWSGKPAAIMGASLAAIGTARAQQHLRQILVTLNLFTLNQPEVIIADAAHRFDENGNLIHEPTKQLIQELLNNLVDWTRRISPALAREATP
jgi:chromate reductase